MRDTSIQYHRLMEKLVPHCDDRNESAVAALRLPLKTDLDLKVADELLGSEEIRVMLANYIRAVEGINGYNINRWMPLILTHDLARHYSLRGTEKKKVSHAYDCSASLSKPCPEKREPSKGTLLLG